MNRTIVNRTIVNRTTVNRTIVISVRTKVKLKTMQCSIKDLFI